MRSARVKARNRLPNLEASPAALATAKAPLQAKMASLAAAVDELSGLLADTGIAVILWDSFFCLRRFSPSINGPFTLTAADIGRTWGELVTKIPDEHLGEDLQKVWNTREAQEARVHCDDGRIYSRRARLYRRSDGEISGVVVLFAEITARAERTLVDSAHSESETMTDAAKQLFLVNLSHELRTPLSAMLLWTKLLLESSSSDPANLKEGLLALRKCAEEQHALIEGLVGTSRTPFGQTDAG